MANFKIGENGLDISSFDLPLNRTIRLLQWGGDFSGNKLEVTLTSSTPSVTLAVLPDKLPAASTAFTVKGTVSPVQVTVGAFVAGSAMAQRFSEDLKIKVCGEPTRQPGYSVDMLSELASTGNAKQIHVYSQIVTGPSTDRNILSQNTTAGHYNCGDVAGAYGSKIFAKPTHTNYYRYYLTPTSDKMADLRFDDKMVRNGISRMKAFLDKRVSVRLWAIHHDGFAKFIVGDTRTHYLTVIGYSGDKFLYIDPWPSGSKLQYDGGMYPKTWVAFLGELTFDPADLGNGINSPASSKGLHTYRIIAGP
ncbi:MAG: hypothetical protein ABJF23_14980 [Bryobacteraceae bacterium]